VRSLGRPGFSRLWPALSSQVGKILLAGFLVREAFSFWTGQPFDLESWIRTGYAAAHGTDPYQKFWPAVPGVSFAYLTVTVPPAAYLPFWPAVLGELYRLWMATGGGNRFALYFLVKQPMILADMGTAYLLFRLVERWTGQLSAAVAVLSFWSFFPYAIAITAVWGQFDSIVVLVILALLYARTTLQRNVLIGIGIFVKYFTAIFLPLEIFRERGWRRLGFLIALVVPLGLTLAVFALEGWSYSGLGASGISQTHGGGIGMNYAFLLGQGPVSAVLSPIPYFYDAIGYLWVPGVILAGWMGARWLSTPTPGSEVRAMLLIVSVFLLLRWGLYEQYLLYLFSLMLLDIAAFHPARRNLMLFCYALAGSWLLVNNDFGIRFLSPLSVGIQPYTASLDASATYGLGRQIALVALAILVTITLVQLVLTYLRDEAEPVPWLFQIPQRLTRVGRSRSPA
jgi:hypothetical protein